MEITYRNSYWDVIWFTLFTLLRRRIYQIIFGVGFLWFSYLAFDVARQMTPRVQLLAFGLLFLLNIGFFLVVLALAVFLSAASVYFSSRENRESQKVVAAEDHILFEASESRVEYKWSGLPQIRRTRKLILIYISTRCAYIVPERAFTTSDEADKFFNYVSDLLIKARVEKVGKP